MNDAIAERAYYKWLMAGKPEGQSDRYWLGAKNEVDPPTWEHPLSWPEPPSYYVEYATFCLLTADGTRTAHTFASCKEYILDFTYSAFHKQRLPSRWDYPLPSLDKVMMLVGGVALDKSLDLVHQFEDALNIPYTVAYKVERQDLPNESRLRKVSNKIIQTPPYVFLGHKDWLLSPPMLSLYGLLIRTSKYHQLGNHWSNAIPQGTGNDASIWSGAKKAALQILKLGHKEVFGTDMRANWPVCSSIHDKGICSAGSGSFKTFIEWKDAKWKI